MSARKSSAPTADTSSCLSAEESTPAAEAEQPKHVKVPKAILHVDWCTHDAAKYAVRHWYYRPEMPVGKLVKVGVWEDEQFIGAVLFGTGASNALGSPYGLKGIEVCELARVALDEHRTAVSRILRVALLFLQKHCPGIRLVVSFADPQHHYGGVYQAMGWVYSGTTAPDKLYIDKAGKEWHSRDVSATGYKEHYGRWTPAPRASDCRKVVIPGKHRYLYPLDAEMRTRIGRFAQPYPKPVPTDSTTDATP